MLISSEEFLHNFLWKYVDMHINIFELQTIKNIIRIDDNWRVLLDSFTHVFGNEMDKNNFLFVLSQFYHYTFIKFIHFYKVQVKKYFDISVSNISNHADLKNFINTNENRLKLLMICLYHYF